MRKYIDAEEFNTHKFEFAVIKYANAYGELCQIPLRKFIKELPSADVVKVVRCKDCKKAWLKDDGDTVRYCSAHCIIKRKDDYCSYGERKDDE